MPSNKTITDLSPTSIEHLKIKWEDRYKGIPGLQKHKTKFKRKITCGLSISAGLSLLMSPILNIAFNNIGYVGIVYPVLLFFMVGYELEK